MGGEILVEFLSGPSFFCFTLFLLFGSFDELHSEGILWSLGIKAFFSADINISWAYILII